MDYKPLEYLPGFEINPQGNVRNTRTGRHLTLCTNKSSPKNHYVQAKCTDGITRSSQINALLYDAFGPGAATLAGYEEPNPQKIQASRSNNVNKRQRVPRKHSVYQRLCHDCGKPTTDFRCQKCWLKLRGEAAESIYDFG